MASIKFEVLINLLDSMQVLQTLYALAPDEKKAILKLSADGSGLLQGSRLVLFQTSSVSQNYSVHPSVSRNGAFDSYFYMNIDKVAQLAQILDVTIDFSTCSKDDMLLAIQKNNKSAYFNYAINKFNSTRARDARIKVKDIRKHMTGRGGCHYVWAGYEDPDGHVIRHISADWVLNQGWSEVDRHILYTRGFKQLTIITAVDVAPCEILSYNTRVEDILPVQDRNEMRFGIELELENATPSNIKIVHDHLKKHAIMKRDGSLSNGVEIVSVPASVEDHKKAYENFFKSHHSLAAKANCGIHIHVSRSNVSFLALGRMMKFLAKNRSKITKIAGRESAQYAAIRDDWDLTSPWYAASNKYEKVPKFNWSKYTGLNIAPNRTMEFRLFKSTTDWSEFCRFLEFTESFVNYHCLAGDDNHGKIRKIEDMLEFNNYHDFVMNRAAAYPNLAKFIRTI